MDKPIFERGSFRIFKIVIAWRFNGIRHLYFFHKVNLLFKFLVNAFGRSISVSVFNVCHWSDGSVVECLSHNW